MPFPKAKPGHYISVDVDTENHVVNFINLKKDDTVDYSTLEELDRMAAEV